MRPRTSIINHEIINCIEQLVRFLKPGDVFRKPLGNTRYRFGHHLPGLDIAICENLETRMTEEIHSNSPVWRLVAI